MNLENAVTWCCKICTVCLLHSGKGQCAYGGPFSGYEPADNNASDLDAPSENQWRNQNVPTK